MPTTHPELHVGDHVQDRNDPDAVLVVVATLVPTASEHTITDDGQTVADLNPDYPRDDPVIEAVYPQSHHVDIENTPRYAFPRSRLERTASVHTTDEDEADTGEVRA